jgi:hypothetical protein
MSEQDDRARWLAIVTDVDRWAQEMIEFTRQVGEVQHMPDVSDADKENLKAAVAKIGILFIQVSQMTASRPPELLERLIASHDRMREELANANRLLAKILATRQ